MLTGVFAACYSSVSKIAPQLSVDQIQPGLLFMTTPTRGGNSYRGIVLATEGRKVCGIHQL